jgi:hyperosmotically inducible protein
MKMSKASVLAGTIWISTAWMSVAAPTPAFAEDQAEVKKDKVDQHAKNEKEQVDQQAKREKQQVDQRAQAKKDEIDRENSARTKPTVGDDVTDAWITTKVKASFAGDKSLKGSDIHVETAEKGLVVLSGYVPNNTARVRAISLAWDTKGVKKVDDQLQLKVAP